jgi:VIT1/CCC1 family predicted Fe2+/Mn2+ transporter
MKEEAKAIIEEMTTEDESPLRPSTLEEFGLAPNELGNPVKATILTGLSFGLGTLVPILPLTLQGVTDALMTSVIATVVALFGGEASKTILSRRSWIRSGH